MAVRATRLGPGPITLTGPGTTLVYTVPADRTLIWRGYVAVQSSVTPGQLFWSMNGTGVSKEFAVSTTVNQNNGGSAIFNQGPVLVEGDTLHVRASAGQWTITAWGSLLFGDPQ